MPQTVQHHASHIDHRRHRCRRRGFTILIYDHVYVYVMTPQCNDAICLFCVKPAYTYGRFNEDGYHVRVDIVFYMKV